MDNQGRQRERERGHLEAGAAHFRASMIRERRRPDGEVISRPATIAERGVGLRIVDDVGYRLAIVIEAGQEQRGRPKWELGGWQDWITYPGLKPELVAATVLLTVLGHPQLLGHPVHLACL